MALDGMQPTFKQVPPSAPRFSMHAVRKPSCAALMAATYPPGPDAAGVSAMRLRV